MEPSNQDLKDSFDRHAADDKLFQDAQGLVNEQTMKSLGAVHERLNDVATKEDVAELKQILKAARVTAGIFNFTFDNASKIGAFVLFLLGIYALAKFGIVGAITWFFKTVNGNV